MEFMEKSPSPMQSFVFDCDDAAEIKIAQMMEGGYCVAAISNAGPPAGKFRITFLLADCFTNNKREKPPTTY